MMSYSLWKLYQDILSKGIETSPRGQKVLEIENYGMELGPYDRFCNFTSRNMNLNYIKEEFKWYLRGDPFDDSICKFATMWKKIQQPDGRFHSNYGQYWFGPQKGVKWVLESLTKDPDSRQAVIPMLNSNHLYQGNTDIVCTESISFRIRDNKLNMSVNMRSNDAIFGVTNDVPCFGFLQDLIARLLDIDVGTYYHKADSMHVYERHFQMLENIVSDGYSAYTNVEVPYMSKEDALIMYSGLSMDKFKGDYTPFLDWLYDTKSNKDDIPF